MTNSLIKMAFWDSATLLLRKRYISPKTKHVSVFFSLLLLAHLSQRLIGELIGYPWSGVRGRPFTISNIFSSEIDWQIKAKFYVEPPEQESLYKWSRSHDQDGRHAHIW